MGDRYQPSYGVRRDYHDDRDRNHNGRQFRERDYHDSYPQWSERRPYDEYSRSPPRRQEDYYQQSRGGSQSQFAFRGAANDQAHYQGSRDTHRPSSDFTFRAQTGTEAPLFPPADHYRLSEDHQQQVRAHRGGRARGGSRGRGNQHGSRGNGTYRSSGGYRPKPAHNRAILREAGRSNTPEQLPGMNQIGAVRFKDTDSTEDSDTSTMDMSTEDPAGDDSGPRKRFKRSMSQGNAVAKWSNPDPYTALPPPESLGAPRKDIVHVIRKAKVSAMSKDAATNAVQENVDFISFDVDEYEDDNNDDDEASDRNTLDREDGEVAEHDEVEYASAKNTTPMVPRSRQGRSGTVDVALDSAMRNLDRFDQSSVSADNSKTVPTSSHDMVMPTDEELANEYGDINDFATRLNDASTKRGTKRKHEFDRNARRGVLYSSVITTWQSDQSNVTPWFFSHGSQEHNGRDRLHDEIQGFYEFVQPRSYEAEVRYALIDRIQRAVRGSKNGAYVEIRCFGSFASGMYLPTADMDLVAVSPGYLRGGRPSFNSKNVMFALKRHLENTGVAAPDGVVVVARAKVPVVKFVDRLTGIKVDISFENLTGVTAVRTLLEWKQDYPAMPVLVVLIKQFLAMRGLNEVFSGGLGGFTIICLVTSMMQHASDTEAGPNGRLHYGELLVKFLNTYGSGTASSFNYETTAITMDPPGFYDKYERHQAKQNQKRLTIIDPNNPENDISGGSSQIDAVFTLFRHAHTAIQHRLDELAAGEDADTSILGCLLGGNYTSFAQQRQKLSLLHRGHSLSPPPPPPMAVSSQPKQKKQKTQDLQKSRGKQTSEDKRHRIKYAHSSSEDAAAEYVPEDSTSDGYSPIHAPTIDQPPNGNNRQASSRAAAITARRAIHKDLTQGAEHPAPKSNKHIILPGHDGDRARAAEFRRQFPQVTDVPDLLTKSQWKERREGQVSKADKQRATSFKAAHPEVAHKIPDSITKVQRRAFCQQFDFHGKEQRKGQSNRAKKQVAKVKARSAAHKVGQS